MGKLMTGASAFAVITALGATSAFAQVDEIVVTATKRAENAQDIPVAVSALGEDSLEELGVDNFTDYLVQLPGVNASTTGPGQGTVYIRGIASSPPLLTTSGAAGLAPNVALYLDEQPVTQVGRNLDVYAADLSRVEVLPGPQGTLFGASSQAGTIRLITNKPDLNKYSAKIKAGYAMTSGGDDSNNFEAMVNIPLVEDKFAVRGVFYTDNQGGYIDNVAGTADIRDSQRFNAPGTVLANGLVLDTTNNGFNTSAVGDVVDTSGIVGGTFSNTDLVEDNFNDARYQGYRLSAALQINDDWSVNVTHSGQDLDVDGVFFTDPDLGDTSVQRYSNDNTDDDFTNTAWTVNGKIGMLDAVYTGAFLDRDTSQRVDYTDYLFVGQYLPYYICEPGVTYGGLTPTGTCGTPQQYVDSINNVETTSHELRFTTPSENRLRATFGGFLSEQELIERNDFTYPGSLFRNFADNLPLPGSSVSLDEARTPPIVFFNDLTRTDDQEGLFAEVTYDLVPDTWSITGGIRSYSVEVDLVGSSNSSFFNANSTVDAQAFGANLDEIFSGTFVNDQGVTIPDKAVAEGEVYKLNVSWTPNDDLLFYATWSEGFRPGIPNRPGANNPNVQPIVRSDEVTNLEFGWKTRLADNTVQFNGNIFFIDVSDLQTTIFDPNAGTNLLFSGNAADAEISGLEADLIWAPASIEGLTVTGAVSILDTEITAAFGTQAIAPVGSDLSYAPSFQGNVRARYEWDLTANYGAHVQGQIVHSGSSYSDIVAINRAEQDAYTMLGATAGISADVWGAELYVDNLTDERAVLNTNFNYNRFREAIVRPRTIGVRFNYDFE